MDQINATFTPRSQSSREHRMPSPYHKLRRTQANRRRKVARTPGNVS
jgi:hypothetical protein